MTAIGTTLEEYIKSERLAGSYLSRTLFLNLEETGYVVGDLVRIVSRCRGSQSTVYKISKDIPPLLDAKWENVKHKHYDFNYVAWTHKTAKGGKVKGVKLYGGVRLVPVFALFGDKIKNMTLVYSDLKFLCEKVDAIALGKMFADIKSFVEREIERHKSC